MINIEEVKSKLNNIINDMKKNKTKITEERSLKNKYEKYRLQKIINSLTPYCRTDKIKSNGNGL